MDRFDAGVRNAGRAAKGDLTRWESGAGGGERQHGTKSNHLEQRDLLRNRTWQSSGAVIAVRSLPVRTADSGERSGRSSDARVRDE